MLAVLTHPVDIVPEHCRVHWPKGAFVIPEYAFAFERTSTIRISGEHAAFEWLDYGSAMARLTWDSNKTALYELNCRLNDWQ